MSYRTSGLKIWEINEPDNIIEKKISQVIYRHISMVADSLVVLAPRLGGVLIPVSLN